MKRMWLLGLSILSVSLLGFAVWAQTETGGESGGEMTEETGGMAEMSEDESMAMGYLEELTAAPYTDWAFEPGVPEGFYTGNAPHGLILRTFINDITVEAVGSGADAFPEGSILVKENHLPGDIDVESMENHAAVEGFEGDISDITYMVKVAGYNPEVGDWFWAKQTLEGEIIAAGQPDGCIGCHTQVADNDYVFDASLSE